MLNTFLDSYLQSFGKQMQKNMGSNNVNRFMLSVDPISIEEEYN